MSKVNGGLKWGQIGIAIAIVLSACVCQFRSDRVEAAPLLIAQESSKEEEFFCPDELSELVPLLLEDLPAYSNRVIQRTQDRNQAAGIENYIITASKAEYQPLKLPRLQYDSISDRDPQQVFFTVFERQYINGKTVEIETYHWLFLTQTDSGWRIVMRLFPALVMLLTRNRRLHQGKQPTVLLVGEFSFGCETVVLMQ